MRRNSLGLVSVALAALVMGALAPVSPAQAETWRTIRLGGVNVRLSTATTQVITVNRTVGWHARIAFWSRSGDGWHRIAGSDVGRIGYGGLVAPTIRKQGSGTTPTGTYPLLYSFGTGPREAGWDLRYVRVGPDDYWVEDNASAYYNRMRSKTLGGFRWWLGNAVDGSERLASYPVQYRMSVVIGFNYFEQVRHRGAGIFLHVNGPGATAGCVSAPRAFLARTMRLLDPSRHPVIAIGS